MFQNLKRPDISIKDILIIGGIIMVSKGLFMINPSYMWIGIGILLFWLGIPNDKR